MSITQKPYGSLPDGRAVTEYTLTNQQGASVSILDLGGTILRILVPDRSGSLADVVLGFDDPATYLGDCGYIGALIGRFGNRIAHGKFTLEGKEYTLGTNDRGNNLHGGPEGFNRRMWQAEPGKREGADALTLRLTSSDGDQGFPGEVQVEVTYTFDDENTLGIYYNAQTDKTTILNLTNHAYFNLAGHDSGPMVDQELQIFSDYVTEVGQGLIPTGRQIPSAETLYSFLLPTRLGDVFQHVGTDPALTAAGGVDFNYAMGRDREPKVCALLYDPASGREMTVTTDQPGVQVYTGQGLNYTGKGGARYQPFGAICLETQHYPDAINHPQFHSVVLRPQDRYSTFTLYRFGVRR